MLELHPHFSILDGPTVVGCFFSFNVWNLETMELVPGRMIRNYCFKKKVVQGYQDLKYWPAALSGCTENPQQNPFKKRWFWTDGWLSNMLYRKGDCWRFFQPSVLVFSWSFESMSSCTANPLCGSKLVQLLGRLAVKKLLNPTSPEICRSFHLKKNSLFFLRWSRLGRFFQTGKGEMDPNFAYRSHYLLVHYPTETVYIL